VTPPATGTLLANLSQDVLHQGIGDVQPGHAQLLNDRCRLCDSPHGLGAADDAERPDDPQAHRLGAASRFQVVEDYPAGVMPECMGK
jgi:hypothetical protein